MGALRFRATGGPPFGDIARLERRQKRGERLAGRDHFVLKDARAMLPDATRMLTEGFQGRIADLRRRGVYGAALEHPAVEADSELREDVEHALAGEEVEPWAL